MTKKVTHQYIQIRNGKLKIIKEKEVTYKTSRTSDIFIYDKDSAKLRKIYFN